MVHGSDQSIQRVQCSDDLIDRVLTAATTAHKILGPGLLESIYEKALLLELRKQGIKANSQVKVPVYYGDVELGIGFRADIIVDGCLLLELKSVESITDIHISQVITYLKLLNFKRGFLLNFNRSYLKQGIKRISI